MITVEKSGKFYSDGRIDLVNGKIVVEDTADVDDGGIYAHVKVEENGGVVYSSLNVAIAEASAGDTIALKNHYVLYPGNELTIPAGITVDATVCDDNEPTDFVIIGSNLTVNGKLIADEFYFVATTDDNVEMTVNGFVMVEDNSPGTKDKWFTPVCISYTATLPNSNGDDTTYFVLTGFSNIQYAIEVAEDKEIAIEGKAKVGDFTVNGGYGDMVEITVKKDFSAGTITMENAKFIFTEGKKVTATFADSQGSIVIRGGYAGKDMEIFNEGNGVTLGGEITDTDDATYSIAFYGITGMEDATISWGYYVPDSLKSDDMIYPIIAFAGDTTAGGKKNEIKNNEKGLGDEDNYDKVTIVGKLTAAGSSRLVMHTDVEVLGILAGEEKTSTGTAGVIDVEGNLFVGTTIAEIYSADDVVSAGYWATKPTAFGQPGTRHIAAAAIVSGKVNIDRYAVVLANSTVSNELTEDLDSIDFFVDGSIWLTIYKADSNEVTNTFYLEGLKAPVKNAKVSKIVNQDDVELAVYDDVYNVVEYTKTPVTFGSDTAVYFNVKYDVFTIYVKTDASIKTVYLDGILMKTGQQENQFYLENQKAGKHTVSVEPMTGYTAANAYLYDDNGVALPGLTFSFDREDCVQNDDGSYGFNIWYNVAGTQLVEPEIAVAGWDITTILLLVLVILIAIMAVIVALRLNRN